MLELRSDKSAKAVAMCIADHWENPSYGLSPSVLIRPTTFGYTVTVRNEGIGSTQLMVDVSESKTGSTSSYYKGLVLGEGSFDDAVKLCQN